ncbi:hypothetical protein OSTOST_08810 [Ostertagia ostertagi]
MQALDDERIRRVTQGSEYRTSSAPRNAASLDPRGHLDCPSTRRRSLGLSRYLRRSSPAVQPGKHLVLTLAYRILHNIDISDIERDMVLFLLLEIRFASLCSLTTVIPAMVVERTFASRFVSIYERIPKPWDLFIS